VAGLLTTKEIRAGVLEAYEGENIFMKLSESMGKTAFAIKNSLGETVFQIDSTGKESGKGFFESGWISIEPLSEEKVEHKLEVIPRDITISKSEVPSGQNATNEGFGQTNGYFYRDLTDSSITVVNGSDKLIYVKIFLKK
jgi:hypothetical protein